MKTKRATGRRRAAARPSSAAGGERVFQGLGVSFGIAIGPAHVTEAGHIPVPEYKIPKKQVEVERKRLARAVKDAEKQLSKLMTKAQTLPAAAAEELGYLLDAHRQMLGGSRLVRGADARIEKDRVNAEAAVKAVIAEIADGFAAIEDEYLAARVKDVHEVGQRLLRHLTKKLDEGLAKLPADAVVIAEDLSPADTALLDPARVAGFATVLGGAESHTAIMARSLALPAVSGAAGLLEGVPPGALVIVDGRAGKVVVDPAPATLTHYRAELRNYEREVRQLGSLRDIAPITRDGKDIVLEANLELPGELDGAARVGAQGIGLLRTEFMFMNRDDLPGEDEQYETLREIVRGMKGRPVTVRTLDVGGDKLAYSLQSHVADSVNPALGLRAIRLSLKVRPLLEAQLAAILRASAHGPLRILLPMISSVSEVRQVRDVIKKVTRRLRRRGVEMADEPPPLGVMIEVPGAALAADALAREAEFFAIGTNDLVMYTLAIDRSEEQVAHLYNPLHPACLRLIQFATRAADRAGIPVSLCGELAGDPRYTALLVGLGIRELSMAATSLPRVKQRILTLDLAAATERAEVIMRQTDPGRITTLLDDFNALA